MAKKKGTILIVDDEKDIRSLLCQKLKIEGYRCKEAGAPGYQDAWQVRGGAVARNKRFLS